MSGPKSLTDLLGDDEDEEEDDDDAVQGSNEFQALLRGNAPPNAAEHSHPGPSHPAATPPQPTSAPAPSPAPQSRGPPHQQAAAASAQQGNLTSMKYIMEFCKGKLRPNEFAIVTTALQGLKAGCSDQQRKDALMSIQKLLGPNGSIELKKYIAERSSQRGTPGQSGGSIMQSLKYNAEQQVKQEVVASQPMPMPNAPQQPFPSLANYTQGGQNAPYAHLHAQQATAGGHPRPAGPPRQEGPHAPQAQPRPLPLPHPQQLSHMRPQPPVAQPRPTDVAPAAKRQKKEKADIEEEMDILKDSGINLEEEQSALLGTMKPSDAPARPVASTPDESFLNEGPLMHKVLDIAKRQGLESVDRDVLQLLSRGLDAHFTSLIRQVFSMTRQRTDADRTRAGMVLTDRIRMRLQEINNRERSQREAMQKVAEEAEVQAQSTKRKQAGEESKKGEKASMRDSDKMQASAANAAAAAAFGGGKTQKWGAWSTDGAKKGASAPKPAATAAAAPPSNGAAQAATPGVSRPGHTSGVGMPQGAPALAPSRVKAAELTARLPDLVAALERDPMYMKSTLLYKMYDQLPE